MRRLCQTERMTTATKASNGEVRGGVPDAEFQRAVAEFLETSKTSGVACPAYGPILPPALHERALAWQRHIFKSGWAGLHWPAEHGGGGLSRTHTDVWLEECERADVAPYYNLQGPLLAGEAIMRSGTDDQQQRFLRPTLTGDTLWCQLFSEPGAGSDLAGLTSEAQPHDDGFTLNGQKVWSSNAQFADFGILMARTEADVERHGGITFFLLDMSSPGVDVRPIKQMTGDQEFCEVFFTDVHVGADAVLGGRGKGWGVAMDVLADERSADGVSGIVSLDRRLAALTAASATSGSVDPLTTDKLMALRARGHALGLFMERASTDPQMASLFKVLGADLGFDETCLEAELRGPQAMLFDEPTERLLYSPGMRIAGGTNEIQRNIIGERVLGLPREPKPAQPAS